MTTQLRSDLQGRLGRFFEDVGQSKSTIGNSVLAVGTTIGPYRADNEDRAATAIIRFPRDQRPEIRVAIVCDGMGGLIEGGKAASDAVAAFISVIAVLDRPIEEAVAKAVRTANRAVYERLQGRGGTTLTAVVTGGREAWCAHVGDSRLYNFGPDGLNLLTQDDTIQGAIHAHEGLGNEDELDNRLLQFVGLGEGIAPHIFRVPVRDENVWIVTSDGAHGIGRKALEALAEGSRGANDMVRRMVFVADALNVKDNASIVAMRQLLPADSGAAVNGTTITVSSPNKSLEIWLSESFDRRNAEQTEKIESQEREPDKPYVSNVVVRKETGAKGKAGTKPRPKRTRTKAGDKAPMEVIFESKRADDRAS